MSLAALRKAQNLSQAKLAEMLTAAGYPATQALVSQWETGAVTVSAERALQIDFVTRGAIRKELLRDDLPWHTAANDDTAPAEGEGVTHG
ncbi:YdaS family helix-turn-helix protein [Luteimonas sp. M1R5S18]|uniref:YdaS family helix-turn-helix protein n=1 Tax=Luteimonas rhizosphaericola TaxID=3042024 RepID=A0ABT6JN96_9GAMM|nr:YdaS family helix-turn-helix protein [Luteimonas rhizosphaericola]MDH5832149.1 YdaS family helix-turn-helix protein [Luteimonas rhizosphaericola]